MHAAPTTRAVILAAGLGSRLRPLTIDRPKPLVPVNGKPILHNALEALASIGITQATIVVGYHKEAIESACGRSFAGVNISYVESAVFDRTGSAYSLYLARDALRASDALILEGDVFFEPEVLARLMARASDDVAAIAPFTGLMSGSAVTLSPRGRVAAFRMNQTAADLNGQPMFKTMNLMRLTHRTLREIIVPALEERVHAGDHKAYVEQILARLVADQGLGLAAVDCGDLKWFEIDSSEDLAIAESIFFAAPDGRQIATADVGAQS